MKNVIATIVGGVLVLALILVSIKYFRNGSQFTISDNSNQNHQEEEENQNSAFSIQDGEPDETSKEFAKLLAKKIAKENQEDAEADADMKRIIEENPIEIEAEKIVTTGKEIRTGSYSYKVDSWEITKSNRGYKLPDGMGVEHIKFYGAELDEDGTITNDYSYVIVDVTVKNLMDTSCTDYIWGYFKLDSLDRIRGDERHGALSPVYLGETPPREYGKNYSVETIPAEGEISKALMFVVSDEEVDEEQLYLEIDPNGSLIVNSSHRWIVLN